MDGVLPDEKTQFDRHSESPGDSDSKDVSSRIDHHQLRKAELKTDLVLVPLVTAFYLLSFIDRANIGNAKVAGLQSSLKLTAHQYSTALTVLYPAYIFAEWPTNLLIKRVGAHIMLPLLCFLWGVVSMCQGFVTTYGGLLTARFFLGLTEGGLLPGIVLTLSNFYRRSRLQFRVSLLFCATSLAGAFSGLLAAAIIQMNGVRGRPGWQWLFILEGLFTAVFGLLSFLAMPRNVSTAWFLSPAEKEAVELALQEDCAGEQTSDPFSWKEVFAAFRAPQVLLLGVAFFCDGTSLFSLAVFVPSIVSSLGYSPTRTQLLSVPPYACAAVLSVLAAIFADHYGKRGITAIAFSCVAVAGFALYLATSIRDIHTLYGSVFLQVIGAYGTAPTISAWQANNISPHYKRAAGLAIAFSLTNCGGILSTWLFDDPPHYSKGSLVNLILSAVVIVACALNMAYLNWRNQQKEAARLQYADGVVPREDRVPDDMSPNFVYRL